MIFNNKRKYYEQENHHYRTYVRIVSAMREFIFNEEELLRVQETFVKAAFAQVTLMPPNQ